MHIILSKDQKLWLTRTFFQVEQASWTCRYQSGRCRAFHQPRAPAEQNEVSEPLVIVYTTHLTYLSSFRVGKKEGASQEV